MALDWPQNAFSLLDQARQGSDLARLIMAGTTHIESWLIENTILPALQDRKLARLHFAVIADDQEQRSASVVPLPDGSAFARNASGLWLALEAGEALHEIQHIGFRFAPGNHWQHGFAARIESADAPAVAATPAEIADIWQQVTGARPHGFAAGALDRMEAFGLGVVDLVLHNQGRLGL